MRRPVILLVAIALAGRADARLRSTLTASPSDAQPGDVVTVTITLENESEGPERGKYSNNIFVEDATVAPGPATCSHPSVTCRAPVKKALPQMLWYYDCSSTSELTIGPDEEITTTFQITIPATAKPGQVVPIQSVTRLRFYTGNEKTRITIVPVAPRLAVAFSQPTLSVGHSAIVASYEVTITNTGQAPTDGTAITFSISDFSISRPPATFTWPGLDPMWNLEPSKREQITTTATLQPQQSSKVAVSAVFVNDRSAHRLRGAVEGGGAPQSDALSAILLHQDERQADPVPAPPPTATEGRR